MDRVIGAGPITAERAVEYSFSGPNLRAAGLDYDVRVMNPYSSYQDFDFDGFLSSFHFDECWDAVFPANTDKYYDIWTLRHPDICPGDYERQMNAMNPIFSDAIIFDACLTNLQRMDFRKLKGWLQVNSAFGGMGVYKTSKFIHSNYFGVKDGYEVSDHVAFHLKAVESGALLYINPKFLVNSKLGL